MNSTLITMGVTAFLLLNSCSKKPIPINESPALLNDTIIKIENTDIRWGLAYNRRFKIWEEIIIAKRKAEFLTEDKYPLKKISNQDLVKRVKFSEELTKKFELEISQHYSITTAIIDSISLEGVTHSWPVPE